MIIKPSIACFNFLKKFDRTHGNGAINIGNQTLAKQYPNFQLKDFPVEHGGFIAFPNFEAFDYAGFEGDAILYNDDVFISDLFKVGNFFDFFQSKLNILRFNNSIPWLLKTVQPNRLSDKVSIRIWEYVANLEHFDMVLIEPGMLKQLRKIGEPIFSKTFFDRVEAKAHFMPPPGTFRLPLWFDEQTYSNEVRFLWNHRLDNEKDPSLFFNLVGDFQKAYPEVPTKVIIAADKENAEKYVSEHTVINVEYVGIKTDPKEYMDLLKNTNFSLVTSQGELYGISTSEAIRAGHTAIYAGKSEYFSEIYGGEYWVPKKAAVAKIFEITQDPNNWQANRMYYKEVIAKIIGETDVAMAALSDRIMEIYNASVFVKMGKRSGHVKNLVEKISTGPAMTKKEIYAELAWNSKMPQYWSTIYYGMRNNGIEMRVVNGIPIFYKDEESLQNKLNTIQAEGRGVRATLF